MILQRLSQRGAWGRRAAQKGFTLVEMAIVLVIIGLIVGGILKGTEIVNNGRVKTQVAQVDAIKASVETFRDKFSYFPGDDPLGATHYSAVATLIGNGDGFVNDSNTTPILDNAAAGAALTSEINFAWYHLQASGLLSGVVNFPAGTPSSATLFSYAGKISNAFMYYGDFQWGPTGTTAIVNKMVRIQGNNSVTATPTNVLRTSDAGQIDQRYDDGVPRSGQILAGTGSAATNCCTTGGTNPAAAACTAAAAAAAYGLNPTGGGSTASPYCQMLWLTQ